ncbi:phage antirepressor KilAC domain-containing protein [Xenorhabdus bovienii]|uniref:hypothetical protein n=1 Tax=Xenorhabdus bovienii TaxID=40576 RepID=UPI00237D0799|nr:hypothetical protein [Xenorhabdus bovienii]MDE1486091.1 phage antirepressor KilAC domain-containing protein [Xenorhabdus bovienii]MDE9478828.1 phage antirepressor KilAC domain-containing protein [Xenorhabdus bovienii]MDE9518962.1 phage antirepressor KilAC domain-containing protein [Xenorhabdus bovienii]MDE9532967.1 phage antirepressor KilAC domain-containing protein [Xenorhabdus bovienii]MDE9540376.1 phage antirepressor KilAC domain-containing protein [Xenorhabdus bovienii]
MRMPTHEFLCWRVAEAYCYHLMKINQSLVYRHLFGDIQVNQHFIAGLLDGRLSEKLNSSSQALFYDRLLEPYEKKPSERVIFIGGVAPELSKRGKRYMNAFLHEFGIMLMDIGIREKNGLYRLPTDEEVNQK